MRPLTYQEWRASRALSGYSTNNGSHNHRMYMRYTRNHAKLQLNSTYGKVVN